MAHEANTMTVVGRTRLKIIGAASAPLRPPTLAMVRIRPIDAAGTPCRPAVRMA